MDPNVQETLEDTKLDESWNQAMESLRKSIGEPAPVAEEDDESKVQSDLKKAVSEEIVEEEVEVDEDLYKSLEDYVSEDPEAEAAMDVAPFLRQLVKSLDSVVADTRKTLAKEIETVKEMTKAHARLAIENATLQKSVHETLERIGQQPIKSGSVKALQKSRFEASEGDKQMDAPTILSKSTRWLVNGKIDAVDAGKIEARLNKGTLFTNGDALDKKVETLLKEEVNG